ncbi:MAG: hypothetical protein V3T21_01110 [Candidatus Margulisiibacteriota bacterium]
MVKRILGLVLVLGIVFLGMSTAWAAEGKGDLVRFGQDLEVPAGEVVSGNAVAIGGSLTVSGRVKGDAVAVGGSLYLKDRARVGGNAVSVGGVIEKSPRAVVKGDVTEVSFAGMGGITPGMAAGGLTIFSLLSFIGFLVLVIILVALFPSQLEKVSSAVEGNLLKTFLYGLLVIILFVPVIILLAISIAGIVLIPVWAILVTVAGLFGYIAAAHFIGQKILKAAKLTVKTMMVETLVGIIILALIGLVPFAGCIIKAILGCMGLGGVALTRFGTQKA